jgi:hypothetical protein
MIRRSNRRSYEAATLPTFIDDAELVWKLLETGRKQEEVAGILGWSREKVAQYNQLAKITPEAWQIVVTSFQGDSNTEEDHGVTGLLQVVTKSVFNEGILRDIVLLTPLQQLSLVKFLLKDPKAKAEYRNQAERYRARNAIHPTREGATRVDINTSQPPLFPPPRASTAPQRKRSAAVQAPCVTYKRLSDPT